MQKKNVSFTLPDSIVQLKLRGYVGSTCSDCAAVVRLTVLTSYD